MPASAEVGATVTFYCSVPGHQTAGVEGSLTIAEGDGSEAAATEEAPEEAEGVPDKATPEEGSDSALDLDANAIRVSALDSMKFVPSHFSAAPGQQIHLVNPDVLVHDIVVDEWGLDSGNLAGGDETTFRIPDDAGGGSEHVFYCSIPGHRESGMTGVITVIESEFVASATPEPEATPSEDSATPVAEEEPSAAVATPAGEETSNGGGETLDVTTVDIAFEPSELSMPADTDVDIHVVNEGALQHDFVIEDTDFATELLSSGQEDTITVNLPAGEYVYFCSVPGHRQAGMEGTLTVG